MQRLTISKKSFFYTSAFAVDCFNFIAIAAEVFMAVALLKATAFQLGVLGAANALGYALPCVWTGLLSERLSRSRMCLIALAGLTVVYAVTPKVTSVYLLCIASFLRFEVGVHLVKM